MASAGALEPFPKSVVRLSSRINAYACYAKLRFHGALTRLPVREAGRDAGKAAFASKMSHDLLKQVWRETGSVGRGLDGIVRLRVSARKRADRALGFCWSNPHFLGDVGNDAAVAASTKNVAENAVQ